MNARLCLDAPQIRAVLALAAVLLALPVRAATQTPSSPSRPLPGEPAQPPPFGRSEPPACPSWRWIGIKTDPCLPCPAPRQAGWTVRPLFPQPDRGQELAPLGLRAFCLYEHPGSGGELTLEELPGLQALDRDCMAVLPAAPPSLLQQSLPQLEARFLRQAGTVGTVAAGSPRVRLALLDTAPTAEDPAANPDNESPHGYSLASMAHKLACSGGACAARVTSRLALPRKLYDPASGAASAPDPVRGGSVGTIGDLAEALRGEVLTWQQPGQPPLLILNLSLGWNGRRFGGLENDLSAARPAVQAVHAALVDALCRGVTAMAAAGNRSWGPDPELSRGPLLPAAWEARAAPSPAACAAALSPGGPPLLAAGAGSLVHAVGAVRAGGAPLENGRLQAEPRLVAFGDHAVVADRFGAPTAMLTGTSVSTLVAATGLAAIWHQLPDLSSFAAVDRLYQYGNELRRPAAVCLGAQGAVPCPPVRQIDVGTVARRACEDCRGPGCAPSCPSAGTAAPARASAAAAFRDARRLRRGAFVPANPRTDAACPPVAWRAEPGASGGSEQLFLRTSVPPFFRCPHWQLFDTNLEAESGAQPGSNPCTACTFEPPSGGAVASSTAYIQIDPSYSGQLSAAALHVGADTYALGDLTPGAKLVVVGLPPARVETVQLSFVVDGRRSATSLFFVP